MEGTVALRNHEWVAVVTDKGSMTYFACIILKNVFKCIFLYMCQKHRAVIVLNERPDLVLEMWCVSILMCT